MASVHSERWYKVEGLRPRLARSARFRRQRVRGEVWHVLSGEGAGASHRLNRSAWSFVGRCNGRRTVAEIWQAIVADNAEESPTQDEIIGLMIQLHGQELVEFDTEPDIAALDRRRRLRRRASDRSRLNPMAFRVGLGNPSRVLARLAFAQGLFSRGAMAGWAVLVGAGLLTWLASWDQVADHAARWLATPRYLLIAWLCYPAIKLVHETAHALAIRRWGGEVREVGLALVFMTPLPYVDASEASLLPRRYQRCVVSAAGIMAELALASAAIVLWSWTEPGLVRDVLFSVALTGSLSTVLFNANPLMRLDGYYLLCDLMQLPNLAARSSAWWQGALVRYGLGVTTRASLRTAPAERPWLVAYAPLSWAWRLLASTWLVLWAGAAHPVLGVAAAVLMAATVAVIPITRTLRAMLQAVPPDHRRHAARLRLAAGIALVALLILGVPLPDRLLAQGVVWVPEEGHLRAQTAGFLESSAADGTRVHRGEPVASLSSIELRAELQGLLDRRDGMMTGVYRSLADDPYQSRQVHDEMQALDEQIALVREQVRGLAVVAGADGRLAIARPQDQPGRYLDRGADLGLMLTGKPAIVRVAVAQEDAGRLAQAGVVPMLRLAWNGQVPLQGRVVRIEPAATSRLPSAALGASAGGEIVTDPTDKDQLTAARPIRLVDIEVPLVADGASGSRAWVAFDLGSRSLAAQALRYARQQWLVRFSPLES